MTDDLKLVERLRDPQFAYYRSNINSLMQQSADAIERLVRERDEARNSLIQARNERDEDRQRRRDLHARHAVEITALRADRDRLAKLVAEMREGLEPFARDASEWADSVSDDHRSLCTEPGSETAHPGSEAVFTVGDLRRARALLQRTQEQVG